MFSSFSFQVQVFKFKFLSFHSSRKFLSFYSSRKVTTSHMFKFPSLCFQVLVCKSKFSSLSFQSRKMFFAIGVFSCHINFWSFAGWVQINLIRACTCLINPQYSRGGYFFNVDLIRISKFYAYRRVLVKLVPSSGRKSFHADDADVPCASRRPFS